MASWLQSDLGPSIQFWPSLDTKLLILWPVETITCILSQQMQIKYNQWTIVVPKVSIPKPRQIKFIFRNRISHCCPSYNVCTTKAHHLASWPKRPCTVQKHKWSQMIKKKIALFTLAFRWMGCNLFSHPGQKISLQKSCIGTEFPFLSNAIRVKNQFKENTRMSEKEKKKKKTKEATKCKREQKWHSIWTRKWGSNPLKLHRGEANLQSSQ